MIDNMSKNNDHVFEKIDGYPEYICFYFCIKCRQEILINVLNQYFIYIDGDLEPLILTCDEMIIKGILE